MDGFRECDRNKTLEVYRGCLYRTLMAYARKKKFWAPGHGNLHLSLESYTLCKDGNWHLLDTYNQKQPPFVMPLQVFPSCSQGS